MFQLILLTVLIVTGHTTDIKQKLQFPAPPVKGFNVNAYLGQWFIQFRKAPCSWSGSSMFTDYENNVMPGGPGVLVYDLVWRSRGTCNKIKGNFLIDGPGVFNNIDNIGDSFSGRMTVTATDYKTFLIFWGCTKMSALGDRCEDPWITISTRQRFPSPIVVGVIESILRTRWGISIEELQKIPHSARCQPNLKKC